MMENEINIVRSLFVTKKKIFEPFIIIIFNHVSPYYNNFVYLDINIRWK